MSHPFHYIVLLDRSQTGQTLFLKSLASNAAKHRSIRGIFLHTDNDRTDQLLQQGVMRWEARKRVLRESNRRLVQLFADAGLGSVGLHWHQIGVLSPDSTILFRNDPRSKIPPFTHLILSNLENESGDVADISTLGRSLSAALAIPLLRIHASRLEGVFVQHAEMASPPGIPAEALEMDGIQSIDMNTWSALEEYIKNT